MNYKVAFPVTADLDYKYQLFHTQVYPIYCTAKFVKHFCHCEVDCHLAFSAETG